ncbi:MAG: hypothetical protein LDL41_15855 [Coleofasciculus sp. S288]|nr:hypothetical protein [Coleofasciculus sp. S288]
MTVDVKDIEPLAEEELGSNLSEVLAAKIPQYQDAVPEEILDLLEEAAETYAVLASKLPYRLKNSARKEIEFFLSLYQTKIRESRPLQHPQPPQKILQLLSHCAS